MKIAITGSIACGKSTVTKYLLKKKYVVIDADKIGHDILLDFKVKEEIRNIFSEKVFDGKEINRKKLGEIVFNSKEKLALLNKISHPRIREIIIEKLSKENDLVFLDMALLFEANFFDLVDKIIVVHLDYDKQLERLMTRNSLTRKEAEKRISSQLSSDHKKNLADFVIDNNGSIKETEEQVDYILKIIEGEVDDIKN
ncbi:dephospho-CoA kinase [Gemella sp. zg-570]|uniref:dephospho-CoA kinase n=1 Tax=Gemella sp. zg-570 TaxID=2840371 RepID=UPI001C0C1AE8|nr:dephospho-CoA kinase [Gemella sp. zg-570]QWQ38399.1 dephospho-CoA kinase [Gemella sp. zg-570]